MKLSVAVLEQISSEAFSLLCPFAFSHLGFAVVFPLRCKGLLTLAEGLQPWADSEGVASGKTHFS